MYKVDKFRRDKKGVLNTLQSIVAGDIKYLKYMMPFGRIINDPAIVLNKDGSLQTTFSYRGPDLESSIKEQLGIITAQLSGAFQRLGTGWGFYFEAQRVASTSYPTDVYFPDELTKRLDEQRRKLFQNGNYYESNYYITMYWSTPSDQEGKIKEFIIEGRKKRNISADNKIEIFMDVVNMMFRIFKELNIPVKYLSADELATYLHSTVSANNYKIHLPDHPILLDNVLYDSPLSSGYEPILGNKHIRVVVPISYSSISYFGMFNELNRLSFPYRWVTRFYCLDKADSLKVLHEYKSGWTGKIKSLMTTVKELFFGITSNFQVNENAIEKVSEVKAAEKMTESDEVLYGFYSTMIVVMDEDEEKVEEKANDIKQIFISLGMKAQTEELNAVDAWMGSIPGNVNHYERRPILSTGNLVHMMPISDIWAGNERNEYFNAPALLYTRTDGNTPFRLNLYIDDVGHSMIVGPTGSGKSVLLNSIRAQFRKYEDAQVFIFDQGSSSRVLTEAVGGNFYDLGNEKTALSFQPLAHIDDEKEMEWAHGWLCIYIEQQSATKVDAKLKNALWEALEKLKSLDIKDRTMLTLYNTVQSKELKIILYQLTEAGPHGKIFDSNEDTLRFSSWQAFEMKKLMETPEILGITLLYIFHRIEQQLTGRKTIIDLDECWIFFDHPMFIKEIKKWLKTLRKENASVVFATQNLDDIKPEILTTVLESCKSKIFLPDDKALGSKKKPLYFSFGLNEKQIQIIASSTPKKHYYYVSPEGARRFELSLSPLELAYFGVAKEDVLECQRILDQYGRESFTDRWEEYKGIKKGA